MSRLFPKRTPIQKEKSLKGVIEIAKVSVSLLTPRERFLYSLTVVLRIAMNGLDLISVAATGLLGAIVAAGISGGSSFLILGFEVPSPTASNVILLIGVIAAMNVVRGGLGILLARFTTTVLATIEIKNSIKVARYLFSGSLGRLKENSRSRIAFIINTSVNAAFSRVLGAITSIGIEGSLLISIVAVFFVVDPFATVGVLLYFGLVILVLQLTTEKRYIRAGRDIQESTITSETAVLEMVDAFREIAVLSKQDHFLNRFGEGKKLSVRTGLTLQLLKELPRWIVESGLIIGIFLFVLWQLSRGTLSEGLIAVGIFMAGSFRIMGAILPLQHKWNDLLVSQMWVKRAQEILLQVKDDPELLDTNPFSKATAATEMAPVRPVGAGLAVMMEGVTYTHVGQKDSTIKSVSIEIPGGSYAAVVGPSGAGKTTLVDLILGLYDPDSGLIQLDGVDPRLVREQTPGLISYVPQRPGLVSGAVAENIALGVAKDQIDAERVREALRDAELLQYVESLPEGIWTNIGEHADSLSGGQAQRLGLARALYTKPRLIILDEATSALDAATEASVTSSIHDLGGDSTVIVIAHRLSTIQHADVVHVMEDGRVVASGTFKQVRQAVPMIEEYVQLMSFDD